MKLDEGARNAVGMLGLGVGLAVGMAKAGSNTGEGFASAGREIGDGMKAMVPQQHTFTIHKPAASLTFHNTGDPQHTALVFPKEATTWSGGGKDDNGHPLPAYVGNS